MKYETAIPLGRGATGEVYKAFDPARQRFVALKYLRRDDPVLAERLLREARLQARVGHELVCEVYEVGSDGGRPFIAMRYIEGQTLEQAAEALTLEQKVRVVRDVAEAVHAAHETGLVHRDLKPQNVMVEPQEGGGLKPFVLDFGLASEREAPGVTETGVILGTPAYMAPEQARGGREPVDRRADVYALGAMLYRLLAGRPPFEGGDIDLVLQALHADPRPLRSLDPSLPAALDAVVARCLEKEPGRRYATAAALAQDLDRFLSGAPVEARAPGALSRALRRARRNPALSAATVVAVVSLLALAAVLVRGRGAGERAAPPDRTRPRRAFAVLGLKNAAGRPEAAWIGTAVTEMLATEMGKEGRLRLVPAEEVGRTVAALGLGAADSLAPDTLARVRSSLGADTVLVGSYLALGSPGEARVRIDLRLQETASGETVAVAAEEGPEATLAEVTSRAATRLRAALGLPAPSPPVAGTATASVWSRPEAARRYAEGLALLRGGNALAARDPLVQAAALEPRAPLVHEALATAWSELGYDGRAAEESRLAFDASQGLEREQRLVVEARYRAALRQWDRVLEIDRTLFVFFPDDVEHGLRLARALLAADRTPDALATLAALRHLRLQPGEALRVDLAEAEAAQATGDFAREKEAAGRAQKGARALGFTFSLVRALVAHGWARQNTEDLDGALADYAEAERLAAGSGDVVGRGQALDHQASIRWQRGDPQGALRLMEEVGALMRSTGHVKGEAGALANACNLLGDLKRHAEAARACEGALALQREIGNQAGVAGVLNNLGALQLSQWEITAAARSFADAARIQRELGAEVEWAAAASNHGNMLLFAGDPAGARRLIEEALAVDRRLGDRSSIAYRLEALADVLTAADDLSGARRALEEAESLRRALGENGPALQARLGLARNALEAGRPQDAETAARACRDEAHTSEDPDTEVLALALQAEALLRVGRADEARQVLRAARAGLKAVADPEVGLRVSLAEARAAAPPGPSAELRQRLQSALDRAQRGGHVSLALEIRLAQAQVAAATGEASAARAAEALARDAAAQGFALVARRARALVPDR